MADRLFRNNGDGTFTDVSRQAGIANPAGKGLGVVFCDFDRDDDVDIYVANDLVRNFLYRNNGDGTFVDVAYGAGVGFDLNGKPQAGMGVDCADYDGNGLPDLYVTNFSEELNTLYQNRGEGLFEDVSTKAGLGSGFGPLGFGTKLFDFALVEAGLRAGSAVPSAGTARRSVRRHRASPATRGHPGSGVR